MLLMTFPLKEVTYIHIFPSLKNVAYRPYVRYLNPGSPPAKDVSIWVLLSVNKLQTTYSQLG